MLRWEESIETGTIAGRCSFVDGMSGAGRCQRTTGLVRLADVDGGGDRVLCEEHRDYVLARRLEKRPWA